jgi:hypothetical protein
MMDLNKPPYSLAALAKNACTTLRFTGTMRYVRATPAADLPIGRCWHAPLLRAATIGTFSPGRGRRRLRQLTTSSNVWGLSRTDQRSAGPIRRVGLGRNTRVVLHQREQGVRVEGFGEYRPDSELLQPPGEFAKTVSG